MRVGGSLAYGTVSIGTSTAPAAQIVAARATRKSLLIQNNHASNNLFVGGDTSVTTANGVKVAPGDSETFTDYSGPLYGVASAASTDVRYHEVY